MNIAPRAQATPVDWIADNKLCRYGATGRTSEGERRIRWRTANTFLDSAHGVLEQLCTSPTSILVRSDLTAFLLAPGHGHRSSFAHHSSGADWISVGAVVSYGALEHLDAPVSTQDLLAGRGGWTTRCA